MATAAPTQTDLMVFRKTAAHAGRHISVTPANSANRHLCYGRIILNRQVSSVTFDTASHETALIVLAGSVTIEASGEVVHLDRFDGIYIPHYAAVQISARDSADLAEFSAEVAGDYPLQVVKYATVTQTPSLYFSAGKPGQLRQISVIFGKNVEAGRLLAGFTVSEPGNWTSWPPHEHAAILEEMYVYFDMPAPAYGIQLVYQKTDYPELVTVVREGDAVLMPAGYHPNVAIPGHRIAFLWAMAAQREKEDRQYGVVNVQPDFAAGGSGLEASRK